MKKSGTDTSQLVDEDLSRRGAAGALLAFGAAAFAGGCLTEEEDSVATQEQALSGSDVKWVDTVLGAVPPATRTGDLATNTASTLGATMAFAKGCVTAGDGGGGLFYWNGTSATDDGGTVIVPNTAGTGAHWRRIPT